MSDPAFRIIESFGIVNTSVSEDSSDYGFPYAGYYLTDREAVVRAKFFNELNADRTTAANILARQFDAGGGGAGGEAETRHLNLAWSASNSILRPGQRALLVLDVEVGSGMHLYAPGDHRYLAIEWEMSAAAGVEFLETVFPPAEMKHLAAIKEIVPVYHDSIRIVRDVHILGGKEFPEELQGKDSLEVTGVFKYQACDADKCYFPAKIPLKWTFELQDHDLVRSPEELRRGASDQ